MDEREYTITLTKKELDLLINATHSQYVKYKNGEYGFRFLDMIEDYNELFGRLTDVKREEEGRQ